MEEVKEMMNDDKEILSWKRLLVLETPHCVAIRCFFGFVWTVLEVQEPRAIVEFSRGTSARAAAWRWTPGPASWRGPPRWWANLKSSSATGFHGGVKRGEGCVGELFSLLIKRKLRY